MLPDKKAVIDSHAEPPRLTIAELQTKGALETPYTVECWVVSTVEPGWIILRDATGGLFAADEQCLCHSPGTHIRATIIRRTDQDPNGRTNHHAAITTTTLLGLDHAFANPLDIVPADMSHPDRYNYRRVTIRGTITNVIHDELDPKWVFLFVSADDACAVAPIVLTSGNLPFPSDDELIDAEVAVRGVFLAGSNTGRKHLGPHVANYDGNAIGIIKPAPKDPFRDCPIAGFEDHEISLAKQDAHRRRTTGRVIAVIDDSSAFLLLENGDRLRIRFAKEKALPTVGSVIDVAGFVRNNVFFHYLAASVWRESNLATFANDTSRERVSARDLLFDSSGKHQIKHDYDGRIIQLRGRVTDILPLPNGRNRLVLNSDGITVNADTSTTTLPDIGSVLDVTGACLVLDLSNDQDEFIRLNGFSIIPRSPADIIVSSSPSWWTTTKLLVALSIITVITLATIIWGILLKRLVTQRSRQLAIAEIDGVRRELKKTERTRLAVELHDSMSQILTGIVLQLDASQNARAINPKAAELHLQAALRMLQNCRTELRRCIWELHSSVLDLPDFAEAITTSVKPIASNVHLTVRSHIPREMLNDNVAHAVLRILRELVTNAIRHGNPNSVRIAGDISTGTLKFSVIDNGCGFPKDGPSGPENGHFGITGIRERLRELGGTFSIENARPVGTKVTFTIPHPNDKQPGENQT